MVQANFFMRIPLEHHKSVYNEHWFPMQQRFAHSRRDLLGGFMWRYLLKDGTFVRRGDVYDEFKKRLDPVADDQLIPTLQDLARFADYYERLRDPTKEQDSPSLQEKLGRLKRWDVTTSYPFLLNIYGDYCADETHSTYLHTIGNLTLTGYNQPLGNKPFIKKKAEFARSHLELNKYFEACDVWNEEAIKHRALTLFGMARRIWHRP